MTVDRKHVKNYLLPVIKKKSSFEQHSLCTCQKYMLILTKDASLMMAALSVYQTVSFPLLFHVSAAIHQE